MTYLKQNDVIDVITNIKALTGTHDDSVLLVDKNDVLMAVKNMRPSESKIGHWIIEKRDSQDVYGHAVCSECGQYWSNPIMVVSFKHCPNCGVKMKLLNLKETTI